MSDLLCDIAAVEPKGAIHVETVSDDRPGQLVRWLSDLNFRHVTERMLFGRFEVTGLSDHRLVAEDGGERIDPCRHTVHTGSIGSDPQNWIPELRLRSLNYLALRELGMIPISSG